MSDELRALRRAVADLATDPVKRTDEEWYDELWELLEPVIDARAKHQWEAVRGVTVHDAGEYRDPATGLTVEEHRFSFEGSTTQLAEHLIDEHGVGSDVAQPWRGGLTQGDWVALDDLHRKAHESEVK